MDNLTIECRPNGHPRPETPDGRRDVIIAGINKPQRMRRSLAIAALRVERCSARERRREAARMIASVDNIATEKLPV